MQQNTIVRLLTTTIKFPNLCTCMIIEIHFIECTEVQFANFFSGGFITTIVVNSLERKLAKHTSVRCVTFSIVLANSYRTFRCHTF